MGLTLNLGAFTLSSPGVGAIGSRVLTVNGALTISGAGSVSLVANDQCMFSVGSTGSLIMSNVTMSVDESNKNPVVCLVESSSENSLSIYDGKLINSSSGTMYLLQGTGSAHIDGQFDLGTGRVHSTSPSMVTFGKGVYSNMGDVTECIVLDSGLAKSVTGSTVTVDESVASIDDIEFISVGEAIAASVAGQTVTLLKDVLLTNYVTVDKNITFDFKGHVLSSKVDAMYFISSAELVNSAPGSGGINVLSLRSCIVVNNSTVTVSEDVILSGINSNGEIIPNSNCVYGVPESTLKSVVYLNGCTIRTDAIKSSLDGNLGVCTVHIKGDAFFEGSKIRLQGPSTSDLFVRIEGGSYPINLTDLKSCLDGYRIEVIDNRQIVKYGIVETDGTHYKTIQDAVSNTSSGALSVLADVMLTSDLLVSRSDVMINLNLGVYTLSTGTYTISVNSNLNLTNGTVDSGSGPGVTVGGGASFIANEVTFTGSGSAVSMDDEASASLTDCIIRIDSIKSGSGQLLVVDGESTVFNGKQLLSSGGSGMKIVAGTFSVDPSSCIPSDYIAKESGGMWTVSARVDTTKTITVSVTQHDKEISGLKVSLLIGSDLLTVGITGSDGMIVFSDIANGSYNLVVRSADGGQDITRGCIVDGSSATVTIELPNEKVNTTVTGEIPVQVDNLEGLVEPSDLVDSSKVEINLKAVPESDVTVVDSMDAHASGHKIGQYVDVSLMKKVWKNGLSTSTDIPLTDLVSKHITFNIKVSASTIAALEGRSIQDSIKIFREHDGAVSELPKVADEDEAAGYAGECFYIIQIGSDYYTVLKAQKFSTYGIAYELPPEPTPEPAPEQLPPAVEFDEDGFYITVVALADTEYIVRDADDNDMSGWQSGPAGTTLTFGPFVPGTELSVVSRNTVTNIVEEEEVEETPRMPSIIVVDYGADFVIIATEENVTYILTDGNGAVVGSGSGDGSDLPWGELDTSLDYFVTATCTVGENSMTAGPILVKPGINTEITGEVRHKGIYITISGPVDGWSYGVRDKDGGLVGDWIPSSGGDIKFGPLKPGNTYDVMSRGDDGEKVEKTFDVPLVMGGQGVISTPDTVTVETQEGDRYLLTDQNGDSVKDSSGNPVWIEGTGSEVTWEGLDPNQNYYMQVVSGSGSDGVSFGPEQIKESVGEVYLVSNVSGQTAEITVDGVSFGTEYSVTDDSGKTVVDWFDPDGKSFSAGSIGPGMSVTVWSRGVNGVTAEVCSATIPSIPAHDIVASDEGSVTILTAEGSVYQISDSVGGPAFGGDARKKVPGNGEGVTWSGLDASKDYYLYIMVEEESGLFEMTLGPYLVHAATVQPPMEYDFDSGEFTISAPDPRKEYAIRVDGVYSEWVGTDGSPLTLTVPVVTGADGDRVVVSRYASSGAGEEVVAEIPAGIPVPETSADDTTVTVMASSGYTYTLVDDDGNPVASSGCVTIVGDNTEHTWSGLDPSRDYHLRVTATDPETGAESSSVTKVKSASTPEPEPEPEPVDPVDPDVPSDNGGCHWWVSLLIVALYGAFMRFIYREGPFDRFAWVSAAVFMIAVLTVAATHLCAWDALGICLMAVAIAYCWWYFGTRRGGFPDVFSGLKERFS